LSDNPLQYLISLPLTLILVLVVLHGEKMLFDYLGIESFFLFIGLVSFVLIIYGCFVLGDKLISMIEVRIKT
jgi:Mn2+/Fe2+ NRAMP family transporter